MPEVQYSTIPKDATRMDASVTISVVVGILIVALIGAWIVRRKFWEHTFLARHGVPGPPPQLIMGNYYQLKEDQIGVLTSWIRKYGKFFGFYLGWQPFIVCTDLDTIRQILVKEATSFHDRPMFALPGEPLKSTVAHISGNEWKFIRDAITPAFNSGKMRLMMPIMQSCVDTFVDLIIAKAKSGTEFDIYHSAQGLTLDVVCKCAFAMETDFQRMEGGLRHHVKRFFADIDSRVAALGWSFPVLMQLFGALWALRPGAAISSLLKNVNETIAKRRAGDVPKQVDILQLLLEAQKTASGGEIENRHVIANAFITLTGGYETTAAALAFLAHILAKRPDVQERIVDEVRRTCPHRIANDEKLDYTELQNLRYLSCVIYEALRLYPPVFMFVSRHCRQSCSVNGYSFPAGCNVLVPVYQIQHDPELWDEPEKFKPERFRATAERAIHPAQFLPFGLGPRMCLGMRFALLELKIPLVGLLRAVRLKPGKGFEDPVKIAMSTVTMSPENGVFVRAELVPVKGLTKAPQGDPLFGGKVYGPGERSTEDSSSSNHCPVQRNKKRTETQQ